MTQTCRETLAQTQSTANQSASTQPPANQPAPAHTQPPQLAASTVAAMLRTTVDALPYRPEASAAEQASQREAACLAVAALRPRDATEAMLATRWVAAHHLVMDGCRTAMQPGLPLDLQLRVVGRVLGLCRLQEGAMRELHWRQDRAAARPVALAYVPAAQPMPAYQAPVTAAAQREAQREAAVQAAQCEAAQREAALEALQAAQQEVARREAARAAVQAAQRELAREVVREVAQPAALQPGVTQPGVTPRAVGREDAPAVAAVAPAVARTEGFVAAGAGRPAAGAAIRSTGGPDTAMQARILADIAARAATSTSALAV